MVLYVAVDIGCGVAGALLLLSLICIIILFLHCYCCCYKKKKKKVDEEIGLLGTKVPSKYMDKEGKKQRDKERKFQEMQEVGAAVQAIRRFGDEREEQYFIQYKRLPELGSRLQKHWFRGHYRDSSEVIVTEAPLTKHCRLTLNSDTLYTINSILLPNMSQHPYVHPIHEIHYIIQENKVLTVQPLVAMGSLRDYIFRDNPLHDWSKKYAKLAQKLPVDKISLFGKQVLEAINFLHKQGFPCLGHVHTGNIYVVSPDHCKLGGYDNTLLGYRTRLYRMCEQHGYAKAIDVVMFGHVMYEMGSGCELEGVVPSLAQDDMAKMEDSITDIVNFIFEQSSNGNNNFKKIVQHSFFAEGSKLKAAPQVEVHRKVKRLLEDVSKGTGKPAEMTTTLQDQDSPKTKALVNVKKFLHENSDTYEPKSLKSFPEIGRRFGKYWAQVRTIEDDRQLMVSISAVPEGSPLNWSKAQQTLNKFFTEVQHPYLHLTHQVHHVKKAHQVVLIQQMVAKGSLRDRIQSTRCLDNWTMKLQDKGYSLSVDKVALYGRQILEAVDHLYSLGFPPLGHLHTGNILVEGDVCRVGGYENTLLGYKTCQRVFANLKHTNSIDLTMFGHVIYELSTGRELGVEFPGEGDYKMVKRKEQVVQILTFIFNTSAKVDNRSVSYQEGLKDVKLHSFFSDLRLGGDLDTNSQNIKVGVAEEVQAFLDKVRAKRNVAKLSRKKVTRKYSHSQKLDSGYPGVTFYSAPIIEQLTSSEVTIGDVTDMGISVFVPQNSINLGRESSFMLIHPCFTGPFELPDNCTPASPTYLICYNMKDFQKDVTIKMHHYASLQNEGDCEDMVFFIASSTPEYKESRPVYTFKEIQGAKGIFKPGDHVGEISLRKFCFLRVGKRTRGSSHYSARLYRSVEHQGQVYAVFCMSLYDPMYMKHCDYVISREYPVMKGKSQVLVEMTGEKVEVNSNNPTVKFDKSPMQILKKEIHIPETLNIDVSKLIDYPPRLLISFRAPQSTAEPTLPIPVLQVEGLEEKCNFDLTPVPEQQFSHASLPDDHQTENSLNVSPGADSKSQELEVPDFSDYMLSLPANGRPHLELQLDYGHEGVDEDLCEIAKYMLGWDEQLSTHLKLTDVDIHDIKDQYNNKPSLQRREALKLWKSKLGFRATYGNLLKVFVNSGHTSCAEVLCELLRKKYPAKSSHK